jgi:hypothetical protein
MSNNSVLLGVIATVAIFVGYLLRAWIERVRRAEPVRLIDYFSRLVVMRDGHARLSTSYVLEALESGISTWLLPAVHGAWSTHVMARIEDRDIAVEQGRDHRVRLIFPRPLERRSHVRLQVDLELKGSFTEDRTWITRLDFRAKHVRLSLLFEGVQPEAAYAVLYTGSVARKTERSVRIADAYTWEFNGVPPGSSVEIRWHQAESANALEVAQ